VNTDSIQFDLVRLTKAKKLVDLSPNTIRAYSIQGLSLYRKGRAVFFSRAELDRFIRTTASRVSAGEFAQEHKTPMRGVR
jgi:hypothetical protein